MGSGILANPSGQRRWLLVDHPGMYEDGTTVSGSVELTDHPGDNFFQPGAYVIPSDCSNTAGANGITVTAGTCELMGWNKSFHAQHPATSW
jgi:hypothetical protein